MFYGSVAQYLYRRVIFVLNTNISKVKDVLNFFEDISKIPRGSGNTKEICDYLENFARKRNLEYYRDNFNNIVIKKDASPEKSGSAPVILQGHTDMVCEKDESCKKDMEREGLDLIYEDDVLYANGTTLGADDGIAIAMMLAVLDSKTAIHPPIEAVMTVDEETGMDGAVNFDASVLKGKRMINIDSEDEGIFTVGCAGGNVTKCSLKLKKEKRSGSILKIEISDLTGGHSGCEINKGRANANKILGRVLYECAKKTDIFLADLYGGGKDNAIAVYSYAVVCCSEPERVTSYVNEIFEEIKDEFYDTDPNMKITVNNSCCDYIYDKESSNKMIYMLMTLPNGVYSMSRDIDELVLTSLNMGVVRISDDILNISFCVRSSIESEKRMLSSVLECMMAAIGGSISISGDYPGWKYIAESNLRNTMSAVFENQYGRKPKIEAIHAGLECGLFADKIKGLDCVSVGPDIADIHTPREKLSISSLCRTWQFILEVLKKM